MDNEIISKMRIMTWNIKDGGILDLSHPAIENIQNIVDTIISVNPDIVVLQEYMSEYADSLLDRGLLKNGYIYIQVCLDEPDRTFRKRVLIASRVPIETKNYPSAIDKYSRRNWCEVLISENKWHILGVDVPLAETSTLDGRTINNEKQKKNFLDAILQKCSEYKELDQVAIILGDFNLHREALLKEYLGYFSKSLYEITNEEPTWRRKKLDYIYVNRACMQRISEVEKIAPIAKGYSDHKFFFFDVKLN